MDDPVLVEIMRGGRVESRHRGVFAIVDADGETVLEAGDTERPIFPRSAVKAIQALPLVESGTADALGFGDAELALACSSHAGEEQHVDLARSMLSKVGLGAEALECGAHWPTDQAATLALAASGKGPGPLHNSCSGKHAGFLCTCKHLDLDHEGYVNRQHSYQQFVTGALENVIGAPHRAEDAGIDGCSIPSYPVPLRLLAHGFAKMATGNGLGRERGVAAKRLLAACMKEPWHVAGTGRACTQMMEAGKGRVFAKTGAEGVFCAAIPELGLGLAVKCDDGATRAAETIVAALLAGQLSPGDTLGETLRTMAHVKLTNWNGLDVGAIRPAGAIG